MYPYRKTRITEKLKLSITYLGYSVIRVIRQGSKRVWNVSKALYLFLSGAWGGSKKVHLFSSVDRSYSQIFVCGSFEGGVYKPMIFPN